MCPRTKEQNERIREARIRQIAASAADVYLERGPGFDIREVALRAGLGYGTVYHYYPTKNRLLDDMLGEALPHAVRLSEGALAPDRTPDDRLAQYAERLVALMQEERSVFMLYKLAAENFHQLPGDLAPRWRERFHAELFAPLSRTAALANGGNAETGDQRASVLLGALVGCAGLFFYRRMDVPDAKSVSTLLLGGILTKRG